MVLEQKRRGCRKARRAEDSRGGYGNLESGICAEEYLKALNFEKGFSLTLRGVATECFVCESCPSKLRKVQCTRRCVRLRREL